METTNIEATAAAYLQAEMEAKTAAKRAKELKADLDSLMSEDQEVEVNGQPYRWTISLGRAPKYKDVLDWLTESCTPDVVVMIEEGTERFTGTRVTKSLKPVEV